jgi:hypothetical protein
LDPSNLTTRLQTMRKSHIVPVIIGLVSELYPIPGLILVPIHSGLSPNVYLFLVLAVNFIIVTGVIYGLWRTVSILKEQGKNSN